MMFLFVILVARSAPASEDGVQLGGMKRPCVLTIRIAREAAETSGAVEEPGRRQAATHLADGERRDERAVRCRVLLQSSALSRSGMSPARADDPDRPRLLHDDPIALSISGPHPVAARLVVGPDDASSRLHSKEQPFTCPLTSYMPAASRYFGFVCRSLGTGVGAAIGVSLSLRLC